MDNLKIAVLIFSRSVEAEAKAKPLGKGRHASKALASFNINNVRSKAAITKLPVIFISEFQQRGISFAERFANAFQDVFDKGFDKVIAIGNDCLSISPDDILIAANNVNESKCVIGPSLDGGAYLIGIHKTTFHKQAFCDIHWQSAFTLSTLQDYLVEQNCDTILLSEKVDIDTISDWNTILNAIPFYIKKKILRLFSTGKKTLIDSCCMAIKLLSFVTTKSLRAPPFSI